MTSHRQTSRSLAPHPESDRLAEAIRQCLPLAVSWSGDLFRYSAMTYANQRDLATGEGSRGAGGRWNPKGAFRALYLSIDPETAQAEVLRHQRNLGARLAELTPLTLVAFQAALHRLLDLTAANVQDLLGVAIAQMIAPWQPVQHAGQEALTQAIGRLAHEASFEGLIVPSAALPAGTNVVIFPGRESRDSRVEIVNPERLPLFRRQFGRRKKT